MASATCLALFRRRWLHWKDEVVRAAVGETALEHFLIVKRHELAMYETHVHPWEREIYLEII